MSSSSGRIPLACLARLSKAGHEHHPKPGLVADHLSISLGGGFQRDGLDRGYTEGPIDLVAQPGHAERYRDNRFFVREVDYYEVRDGFPRIRTGDFPPGVVDITYKLDPAALTPFGVERAAVEGWLKP